MISSALQQLYNEHLHILLVIDQLREVVESHDLASRGEEVRALLDFFREYGDNFHHHKEEHILFPVLAETNPGIALLIENLEEHHEQFRDALTAADSALADEDWGSVRDTLIKYVSDLTDHISAEDEALFVSADEMLTESEKERIHFLFMDADRELGVDRKQEYEGLAHQRSFAGGDRG